MAVGEIRLMMVMSSGDSSLRRFTPCASLPKQLAIETCRVQEQCNSATRVDGDDDSLC